MMQAAHPVSSPTENAPSAGHTGWTQPQAEDVWNAHGACAYALARVLVGDQTSAKQVVVQAMTDLARAGVGTSAGGTRRTLARHIYRHSTELMGETARTTDLSPTMARLAHLARLQRASLALCAFGGHTYQQAADLLGVAPLTVAGLLTSGLDELRGACTPGIAVGA